VHFGSRFAWDREGHLFFTLGERGTMQNSQDLKNPLGKIHRVNDDGSIPKDNPFLNTPNALPSIWSYGHRNPQGLAWDPSGLMWESEHGPTGGDEINVVEKGRNYGWGVISMGLQNGITERSHEGMEQPIVYYTPTIWRVVYGNANARRPAAPALSKATPQQLVQTLANPKGWWRDTAQRLLVERGCRRRYSHIGWRQGRDDRPDAAARPGHERRTDCGRAHLHPPRLGTHRVGGRSPERHGSAGTVEGPRETVDRSGAAGRRAWRARGTVSDQGVIPV
jgi:hypothetical protein